MGRRSNNLFNFLTRPRILLCLSAKRKTNQRNVCLHKTYPKMSITKALTQNTHILYWALLTPQLRWQFYHWLMLACTFYTRTNSQRTDKLQRIFNHLQFLDTLKFMIYKQFHLPCRTIWRESVAAVRTRATGQKSCISGGQIDVSCCVDSHFNRACQYRPGLASGVLCCKIPGQCQNWTIL